MTSGKRWKKQQKARNRLLVAYQVLDAFDKFLLEDKIAQLQKRLFVAEYIKGRKESRVLKKNKMICSKSNGKSIYRHYLQLKDDEEELRRWHWK